MIDNGERPFVQIWDKLFKLVGDYFPEEIVRFVFPNKQIKLCGKYEQEKIVLEYQIADINFWIEDQGTRKLLNIEPYSSWKSDIPALVFTRNAIITKSLAYHYEVVSVVVLLEREPHPGSYEVKLGNEVVNHYRFPVVSLGDIEGILQKYRPLAPFILKVDRSYQEQVIDLVRDDKLLKAVTVLVLNRLGFSQEEALKMTGSKLEEFRVLLDVPILQGIWKEDTQMAAGKAKQDALMKILAKRLGNIPPELEEKIRGISSIEQLDEMIDLALMAQSLEDFKRQMRG